VLHAKKEDETMKTLLTKMEKANAQIAHLQFARTDTQTKIAKELFFAFTQFNHRLLK